MKEISQHYSLDLNCQLIVYLLLNDFGVVWLATREVFISRKSYKIQLMPNVCALTSIFQSGAVGQTDIFAGPIQQKIIELGFNMNKWCDSQSLLDLLQTITKLNSGSFQSFSPLMSSQLFNITSKLQHFHGFLSHPHTK